MPGSVALSICVISIIVLLVVDSIRRPNISSANWIPLACILIVGSRPVSLWIAPQSLVMDPETYVDGSPVDRWFYLAIIISGLLVLAHRKVSWSAFSSRNIWLVLYFAYCGLSVLWSDYPFVAFKRWIKDGGQLVMVLIILSDRDPIEAMKAVLVRCSYVLIPVSTLLVKYFPDIGRSYNQWTGIAYYSGATTDKNLLGMVLTALAISLVWTTLDLFRAPARKKKAFQLVIYLAMLYMTAWLLLKANSATALLCTAVGVGLLLLLSLKRARKHVRLLLILAVLTGIVLYVTDLWSNLQDALVSFVGRDPSFTGRREIWDAVFGEKTNPLVGVGFYSFWMGDRIERLSAGYHYLLNEAHNGYIEIYLNLGVFGLTLLGLALWSMARRSIAGIANGDCHGADSFRLAVLVVVIVYSFSEAIVNRLDLLWFALLLTLVVYPRVSVRGPSTPRSPAVARTA